MSPKNLITKKTKTYTGKEINTNYDRKISQFLRTRGVKKKKLINIADSGTKPRDAEVLIFEPKKPKPVHTEYTLLNQKKVKVVHSEDVNFEFIKTKRIRNAVTVPKPKKIKIQKRKFKK